MNSMFLKVGLAVIIVVVALFAFLRISKSTIETKDGFVLLGYSEASGEFLVGSYPAYTLTGPDGPYIIGDSIYVVSDAGEILVKPSAGVSSIQVANPGSMGKSFEVQLRNRDTITETPTKASLPSRVLAVSDIEGNWNAFTSLLQAQGVIDTDLHWTFGNGELVTVGDFMDRGEHVTEVLWLIHQLEFEAHAAGGRVTFLLGNHETMTLRGNWKYARGKYKALADHLAQGNSAIERFQNFYGPDNYLGAWLHKHNSLALRGEYLFVHAGLHPQIADLGIDMAEMNATIKRNLGKDLRDSPSADDAANFLMGDDGPLWYRGLVQVSELHDDKIDQNQLNRILAGFDASRVVIGHTIVDEVSTDYNGKVIRIDVKHGAEVGSADTQGLLIEAGKPYRVDASGAKRAL